MLQDVVHENEYDIVIGDDENLLELEKFLSDQKVPNKSDMFGKFFVLPYKGYNVIFYNNRLIKFLGHDLQTQDEKAPA